MYNDNATTEETRDKRPETSAEPELLPCPFCGELAAVTTLDDSDYDEMDGYIHMVGCESLDCGAMPVCSGRTPAEAAAQWNTRDKGGAA